MSVCVVFGGLLAKTIALRVPFDAELELGSVRLAAPLVDIFVYPCATAMMMRVGISPLKPNVSISNLP